MTAINERAIGAAPGITLNQPQRDAAALFGKSGETDKDARRLL